MISRPEYHYALQRIEELLPYVTDETPLSDPRMIELMKVSEIVEKYEKEHHYRVEDLEIKAGKVVRKTTG